MAEPTTDTSELDTFDPMESLTEEQYESLYQMVTDPENKAGESIRNNPEALEYATAVLEKHAGGIVRNRVGRQLQAVAGTPGTAGSSAFRGTTAMGLKAGVALLDFLKSMTPRGGTAEQQLIAGKEKLRTQLHAVEEEQKAANEEAYRNLGPAPGTLTSAGSNLLGELGPWMALPGGMPKFWQTVLLNFGLGGAAGAMADPTAEDLMDRLKPMTVGAVIGAAGGSLLHAREGFQTAAARRLDAALNTDLAKANLRLEEKAKALLGDDFSFDLAQITANPFIVGLQLGSAKELTREFQGTQIQRLIDYATFQANRFSTSRDPELVMREFGKTITKIRDEFNTRMTSHYGQAMDNIVKHWGDDVVIDGRQYYKDLMEMRVFYTDSRRGHLGVPSIVNKQIDQLDPKIYPYRIKTNTIKRDGEDITYYTLEHKKTGQPPKGEDYQGAYDDINSIRQDMDLVNMEEGGLTADDIYTLLEGFRVTRSGEVGVSGMASAGSQQQLANWMESSLLRTFEDAAENLKPEAVESIMAARSVYAFEIEQRNAQMNRLLAHIFLPDDKIGAVIRPRDAVDMLIGEKSTPTIRKELVKILEEDNPQLLGDMRSYIISEWVRKATVDTAPASMPKVSPVLLSKNLRGQERWGGEAALGLFSEADQLSFRQFAKILDTMKETYAYVFPEASGQMLADTAINLQSRSPEFMARYLTRLTVNGKYVERILHDPAFREAAVRVANAKGRMTPKLNALVVFMSLRTAQWMVEAEAEERAKKQEQARQEAMMPEGA